MHFITYVLESWDHSLLILLIKSEHNDDSTLSTVEESIKECDQSEWFNLFSLPEWEKGISRWKGPFGELVGVASECYLDSQLCAWVLA